MRYYLCLLQVGTARGSKQFGHKTFWVNRLQTPPEELDVLPDGTGKNLNELLIQFRYRPREKL